MRYIYIYIYTERESIAISIPFGTGYQFFGIEFSIKMRSGSKGIKLN